MHLHSLSLRCFRIYEESHFKFTSGINVIYGDNAKGKTSLLEAIHFLMAGRSFRTTTSTDMIHRGSSNFLLDATFNKHGIEQKLKVYFSETERQVIYNTTPYPSLSSLLGILQGVVIHPDDAALVKGAPLVRRHFLDLQIAQIDPLYVHSLTRYSRAMRQRNYLLRSKRCATIESWEHEMANAAAYLVLQRRHAVEDLIREGRRLHQLLSGEKVLLNLIYKTPAPEGNLEVLKHYYHESFRKHRPREIELGVTLIGPHKDDLIIALDDKDARYFASEGQQRTCVAALRLSEWERLKKMGMETPMILLDDVGVSLDQSRRTKLFEHLTTLGQVFLTSTERINHLETYADCSYHL